MCAVFFEKFEEKGYKKNMDLNNLEKVLASEPKYRLKQAREAIFKSFISNWDEATFFSKDLREKLNAECPLKINAEVLVSKEEDSVKAKITLKDDLQIESVLMRHKDGRNTVCVSCQVGCPLGCLFCATGKMGFKRNLTTDEILEQVILFERLCKVTNVTFMGMGEPFLNYDNVLKAVKILNDKDFFNIGARSISISTAGIIEGIEKLIKEGMSREAGSRVAGQINLAISLHAPNDKLRSQLMPINKKYPLAEVLKAVDDYIKKTKRKVMFEYVLIDGVNDSEKCAKELAGIMRKKLYFVNLILYNPTGTFRQSSTKQVEKFKKILEKEKINFVQRYRFGDDIQAACGQFATNK
ncbi:MAG: 23S rRNA (adenine(2503)-C(2))-methyltransferase RlmN [Candidatus Staskawiczbacteria bacterium]|nr:23S rRNA (adenine(2503)-C(2))-methyltransferase RlmN [Candidatus Staskawiczbacteria bacterium]